MLSNFRSFNYEAKSRAKYNVKNNLKQLGLAVHRSDLSKLSQSKRNELDALNRKVQEAQTALEGEEQAQQQQQAAQQPVDELEDTLQLDNSNRDFAGKESGEVRLDLEGVSEGKRKDADVEGTITRGAQTRAKRGELREFSKGQAAAINAEPQSGEPEDRKYGTISGRGPDGRYTLEAGSRSIKRDEQGRNINQFFADEQKLGNLAVQPRAAQGQETAPDDDLPPTFGQFIPGLWRGQGIAGEGGRAVDGLSATLAYSQGGLSLPIDLPQQPQKLTFSKVGGDPQLVIGLRPRKSLDLAFGFVWTVLWLALGVAVIAAFRTPAVAAAPRRPSARGPGGARLRLVLRLPAPLARLRAPAHGRPRCGVAVDIADNVGERWA